MTEMVSSGSRWQMLKPGQFKIGMASVFDPTKRKSEVV